jgi:N-terminal half of MaoC dehydratase
MPRVTSETASSPYQHLVGHKLPGATYTLPEYLTWLWHDAVLVPPDSEVAHPSLGYFVAMQGVGVSIQDLFDLFDATADSGVMFGEAELDFAGTLRPGGTYACDAEIVAVERKEGKRAGVFDKMTFVVRVRDQASGEPVVTSSNTWIFPRAAA